MAVFLPALIVLGGAAAALFASCAPSKDPEDENPESDDPSATPFNSTDSTPQNTYSDDSETPASSTATVTPWPPSTTPYFTPTPASTSEPTDDDVPTPTVTPVPEPDLIMNPGEFTLVFHLILPDEPTEDIIPVDSYLDGIARTADSELRKATDGKYGLAYYPDEDLDDPTDFSNRVVVHNVYSSELYEQTLGIRDFSETYDAAMGEGSFEEDFSYNAINVIIAPNTASGSGGGGESGGYAMAMLHYNLAQGPQPVIASLKTAVHEIVGHGFGVAHPHEGGTSNDPADRTSELVTREDGKKNCDQDEDGDGICDTEADPGINQGCDRISLATCKVQCAEPETGDPMVDADGDEYDPDASLVMSYYTDDCVYALSEEESALIEATAQSVEDNIVNHQGGHYAPPSSLRRLAPPAVITVDPLGIQSAYTTLGSALRAGRDGVKIYLTPSTYYENAFFAGTHALIFGQGSIIDGMDFAPTIKGVSASLSIEALTIRGGYNPDSYDCGGGISISDDGKNSGEILLSLKNSVVTKNTAVSGAGICASHGGRVEILNSRIESNTATLYGGGIYTYNVGEGSVIEGSEIRGNMTVQGYGGGISINQQYSPLTLRSTLIEDNQADYDGGGFAAMDANVVFDDVECIGNMASGGGCFTLARAGLTVYDSSIFGNSVPPYYPAPAGYAYGSGGIASILITNTGVFWEDETSKSNGPNFQMYTYDQGLQPKTPLVSGVAYYCDTEVGTCVDTSTGQTVAKTRPPVQVMPAPVVMDSSLFRGDDTVPISALPDRLRRIMESVQFSSN